MCLDISKKIPKRLLAIAELIKEPVVADIGCDHGYLSIYLAKLKGVCVYACDVRKRPLERAKKNAKSCGVFEDINFLLTDGLNGLPNIVECVVIAGMGAELIMRIIFNCSWVKNKNIKLILQPQSFLWVLRDRLYINGFYIEYETVVYEKNKFYNILVVRYSGKKKHIDFEKAVLGKICYFKNIYSDRYLNKEYFKVRTVLKNLKKASDLEYEKIEKYEIAFKILKRWG